MRLRDIKPYRLPFYGVQLPAIVIEPDHKRAVGAALDCDNLTFLTQLCRAGYSRRGLDSLVGDERKQYGDRVKMELGVINELGFVDYILMVWDICRYADEAGIPRGPGRGSVAGSLVAYLIGITELDPIENDLFFTRFLSKARAKSTIIDGVRYIDGSLVPDIDCDFSHHRRKDVIEYLHRRYPGQTSKALTTLTYTSKALLKDMLKVVENADEGRAGEASDLIDLKAGTPEEVEDALLGDYRWRAGDKEEGRPPNARFVKWAQDHEETVRLAMALSGLNHAEGQHASALFICHKAIDKLVPLQLARDTAGNTHTVSGYDMYSAQEIVIKMDILGVRSLDVIKDCCDQLGITPDSIDVHHESIYRYLQDFRRRYGVFQLETFAQGNAARKVKPKTFDELAVVLAIARPGAIDYLDQFAKYTNEGIYESVHPLIDDILKPTGGVCVFQEQYLAMLRKVGMTDERAENARRVLGKKKVDEVPAVQAEIAEVCERNGHPKEVVDLLLKIAYDSGGFSFNKSHAAAYAIITARTLYLKVNHPLQFYFAVLRSAKHESKPHDVVAAVEQEMRVAGYKLLPPSFAKSDLDFTLEGNAIRYGLGLVRGISDKTAEKLELFRAKAREKPLTKLEVFQAIKNAGLHLGIGCSLIQAGCLAGYDVYTRPDGRQYTSRSRLVLEYTLFAHGGLLQDKERTMVVSVAGRPEVQHDVFKALVYLVKVATDEKGRPLIKESRFETIKRHYQPHKAIYELNSRNERLACYYYERRVLGYSYSETIGEIFSEYVDGLITVEEAMRLPAGSLCRLIGFVGEKVTKNKTSKGNDQLRFTLEDETGECAVKAFNDRIELIEEQNGRCVEPGDLVIASVKRMDSDMFFCQAGIDGICVAIQSARIYMGLADLRDKEAKAAKAAPQPQPV